MRQTIACQQEEIDSLKCQLELVTLEKEQVESLKLDQFAALANKVDLYSKLLQRHSQEKKSMETLATTISFYKDENIKLRQENQLLLEELENTRRFKENVLSRIEGFMLKSQNSILQFEEDIRFYFEHCIHSALMEKVEQLVQEIHAKDTELHKLMGRQGFGESVMDRLAYEQQAVLRRIQAMAIHDKEPAAMPEMQQREGSNDVKFAPKKFYFE